MNVLLQFLHVNRERFAPLGLGPAAGLSCMLRTPRFHSSRNVVFFVFPAGSCDPVLVAKIPRVDGALDLLAHEAGSLRTLQKARPGGFASIPRLVAHEEYAGAAMLVETALPGRLMKASVVRRHLDECIAGVHHWLCEIHRTTLTRDAGAGNTIAQLVATPLARLAPLVVADAQATRLLSRTRDLTSGLREAELPLVFEHGDLSAPNLLLLSGGGVGVVDWELSQPQGLPAVDLFFFLAFAAFARRRAETAGEYVAAFREAFFGPKAWSRPHVLRYAEAVGLPRPTLKPLFLLCWSRVIVNLGARMALSGDASLSPEDVSRLQQHRFWRLWEYAVQHADEIDYEA